METVRRAAVIRESGIIADCPLDGYCVVCLGKDCRPICGWYNGSHTNVDGSFVVCGFVGR